MYFVRSFSVVFFLFVIFQHVYFAFFFFNDPPPPEIYPLPLHAALPIYVQLARGLTEPSDHRARGHLRPGNRFAAPRQERGAEVVEPQGPPQCPPQPHVAERPRALDADAIETDRDRVRRGRGRLEELPLIGAPGDRLRQAPGPYAPLAVELAEVRGGLLHHLPPAPHRAHQPPVRVRPAPLPHHRVPQVHRTPPRTLAIATNRKARKGPEL